MNGRGDTAKKSVLRVPPELLRSTLSTGGNSTTRLITQSRNNSVIDAINNQSDEIRILRADNQRLNNDLKAAFRLALIENT